MKKIELPEYVIADIPKQVKAALEEDIGSGDITAMLIDERADGCATLITRERAIMCGKAWANEVFAQLGGEVSLAWHVEDGDALEPNQALCELKGNVRQILTGERTALNFLQSLMGTAQTARTYVHAVAGKNVTLLDTRKTVPCLRTAQKYAVLCGGGANHRLALYDAFLIKENHIAASGSIASAVANARTIAPHCKITVEVETLEELSEAIACEPDQIMLDNFSSEDVTAALKITPTNITIELSGNFDLARLQNLPIFPRPVCISIGGLTKHIQATDLSLRLQ
ncbi:MAG: carboxylating nicotinate-nucleotide diphosphorylase [Alcanivoracaceae bacterium]|nr:carboxylating nicotinate-nucleotide diphosphorylase [Alcanivoracaceae bacterium]